MTGQQCIPSGQCWNNGANRGDSGRYRITSLPFSGERLPMAAHSHVILNDNAGVYPGIPKGYSNVMQLLSEQVD